MACPNINTPLFKDLEKEFGFDDAMRINYRITEPQFDKWYKDGERDAFGNPRVYGNYFINGNNKKFLIAAALKTTEEERGLWRLGNLTGWRSFNEDVPTELSKAQWVHVRTNAFKDWFGDWQNDRANGPINPKTGDPLIVYHNRNLSFSTVKKESAYPHKFFIRAAKKISAALAKTKKGVSEVFSLYPDLASIGTKEQYSQYLNTIFPDSKVKDILYHGTNKNFDAFKIPKNYGAFFSSSRGVAKTQKELRKGKDTPLVKVIVLINIQNPKIGSVEGFDASPTTYLKDNDGLLMSNRMQNEVVVVTKESQIHMLGSQKDVQGFRNFIKENPIGNKYVVEEKNDIKSATSNNGEYKVGIDNIYKSKLKGVLRHVKETFNTTEQKGELLKNKFSNIGIDVNIAYDENLSENANVTIAKDGKITITLNPNKTYSDTVAHEFSHIYIDLLGYNHPLVKSGIKQLKEKSPELWDIIQNEYANENLTQEQLEKELLVTAMGIEASGLMEDNPEGISSWKATVRRIFRAIGKLFGVETNIAKELFSDILYSEFRISEFKEQLKEGTQKSKLNEIKDNSSHIKLDETSSNPNESFYKNTRTGKIMERLTEMISGEKSSFSYVAVDRPKDLGKFSAERAFLRQGKDKDTEKVSYIVNSKSEQFTFTELVNFNNLKYETDRSAGKIGHAIIEKIIKQKNGQNTDDIDRKINLLSKEIPGKQNAIPEKWFNWLENSVELIFSKLGITFLDDTLSPEVQDKVEAEVILHSDIMDLGTTADTLVEHLDGSITMIDWKAGNHFLNDFADTSRIVKYSGGDYIDLYDNKVGRAKLELMLRAMIIKENNPDIKFRNLTVAHLHKTKLVEGFEVSIEPTLKVLEKYFRTEKPEQYKKLKEKGIFNANSYSGIGIDMQEDEKLEGMSTSDKLKTYKAKLFFLTNELPKNKHNDDEVLKITQKILELGKEKGEQLDWSMTSENDMGFIATWIGDKYKAANKIIQTYIKKIIEPAQKIIQEELDVLNKEHNDKLIKVVNDYFKRRGLGKKSDQWVLDNLKSLTVQYGDIFGFMWEYVETPGKSGWYARTDMNSLIYDAYNVNGRKLTAQEKEYSEWYRKTIAKVYSDTMSMPGNSENESIAKILGKSDTVEDNFMPRVPMTIEEVNEAKTLIDEKGKVTKEGRAKRIGRAGSQHLKRIWNNHITTFTEESYKENRGNIGLPVKYIGNSNIIESQNHTLNTEIMFQKFITGMISKKHMDPVYAVGQGVLGYLNSNAAVDSETGELKFPNLTKWLEAQIKINVLSTRGEENFTRKGWKVPNIKWFAKDEKGNTKFATIVPGKYKTVSIYKIMKLMKTFIGSSTIWLKPFGGMFNGVLMTMLNAKSGLKNSIVSKIWKEEIGKDPVSQASIDYTYGDLVKANKQVLAHWGKRSISDVEKDKLHLLMKKFRFLPENYDYAINNSNLISGKNKPINQSHLYLFHAIPEEWGQQKLLVAMMMRMQNPKTGKSIWDSYEVSAKGELEWKGGTRFQRMTSTGEMEDVTGLTSEEVNRMKRVSQKIHGGYRNEERTMMELTALGQWALQFKKYLPAIMMDAMQGKYQDVSLGNWKQVEGKEDVYTWMAQANEGRILAVTKWFAAVFGMRDGSFQNYMDGLSIEEKKQVTDFFVSMGMWIVMLTLASSALDDDEEDPRFFGYKITKSFRDRVYQLVQDATQGYNPLDWARSLEKNNIIIPKLFKVGMGLSDVVIRGIIKGERIKRGRYVGNMPGSAVVKHNVPGWATTWEFEKYLKDFGTSTK